MGVTDYSNILNSLSSKEFKETLLEKVTYAIDNYGNDPKEYYKWTNLKIEKINGNLRDLILMHKTMFDEGGEELVKKLYVGCNADMVNKEYVTNKSAGEGKWIQIAKQTIKPELFDNKEYKEFYVDLRDYMDMWLYGAKKTNCDGYSVLLQKLLEMQFMLVEGRARKETVYQRYKQELAGNEKPEDRDLSFS